MGVCKKGRRKIRIDNRDYIWYVELDYDSPYHILNIVSEDKSLILSFPMKTTTTYLISKGNTFQNKKTNGIWNRYLLPFNIPEIITPKFVAKVIVWATQNNDAVTVEWNGKDIPL